MDTNRRDGCTQESYPIFILPDFSMDDDDGVRLICGWKFSTADIDRVIYIAQRRQGLHRFRDVHKWAFQI